MAEAAEVPEAGVVEQVEHPLRELLLPYRVERLLRHLTVLLPPARSPPTVRGPERAPSSMLRRLDQALHSAARPVTRTPLPP
ncbi:hypothetical protein GCM10009730_19180 [Streptomyces albidochromogenes]